MKPFLSIITINFNDADGLQKTIDSVLAQTYSDFEYIVIDGGSTDGSFDILKKNKEHFSYWKSEADRGVYHAMNKGISVAKGTYLQFLNSGDTFTSSNALEAFIGHKDFDGDIIYGDYAFEEGGKIYPDHLTPFFFIKSSLPHQSTFFHKKVFIEIGNYNESYTITSDREFYIKCFLSGAYIFTHVNYALTLFNLEGRSNDPKIKERKRQENEQMLQEHYGIFYEDYVRFLELWHENNRFKKKSVQGYYSKMISKLKNLW